MEDKNISLFEYTSTRPLAYESRPNIDEFVGQKEALGIINKMLEKKEIVNLIIFGPAGTGKTSISRIIADKMDYDFEYLNAISSGTSNIKEVSKRAKENLRLTGKKTILLFDEIHRFNKLQQDSLLEDLEDGSLILIATTTENPYYNLNKALISRCIVLEFKLLSKVEIKQIILNISNKKKFDITDEIVQYICDFSNSDARTAINLLELIIKTDFETVKQGINKGQKYDVSDKYDRISALIKSIRGSDADATVYWLASLLAGGEDIKYIARRLVISSCEDIGLANPEAINIANSTMQAVEKIGMPEARIILSHCAIYLALSPKSNSAYNAINKAMAHIDDNGVQNVPMHLRPIGEDRYKYPHNYNNHYVNQKYMEKFIRFYEACNNKFENISKKYWKEIKGE